MRLSHITKMPDLNSLTIPPKLCQITLKDEVIFHDLLNQHRTLEVRKGGACQGDYVLVRVEGKGGNARLLHLELGGKQCPEYEEALLGATVGQTIQVKHWGEETTLQVQSVKKMVDLPLTDQAIGALEIPGVRGAADYRLRYIREHRGEITDKVFRAIQEKLLRELVDSMEVSLDEGEMNQFHQRQRDMIQSISGDVEQRLMDAYGGDKEESDRRFFQDNKRSFLVTLWGRTLAQEKGWSPSQEERNQALEYYKLIHEKTEAQVEQEGLMEDVLQPVYMQYGIRQVKDYFRSKVRISARDVEAQAV